MLLVLLAISIVLSVSMIAAEKGWFRSTTDAHLSSLGFLLGSMILAGVNLNIIVLLLQQVLSFSTPYEIALSVVNVILLFYSWWFFFGRPR